MILIGKDGKHKMINNKSQLIFGVILMPQFTASVGSEGVYRFCRYIEPMVLVTLSPPQKQCQSNKTVWNAPNILGHNTIAYQGSSIKGF